MSTLSSSHTYTLLCFTNAELSEREKCLINTYASLATLISSGSQGIFPQFCSHFKVNHFETITLKAK